MNEESKKLDELLEKLMSLSVLHSQYDATDAQLRRAKLRVIKFVEDAVSGSRAPRTSVLPASAKGTVGGNSGDIDSEGS